MKFKISDPNNVWRVSTRSGHHFFVRCASKSGAKTFVASRIGIREHAPFQADFYLEEQVPEGEEILQAVFPAPHDPKNWTEEGRV